MSGLIYHRIKTKCHGCNHLKAGWWEATEGEINAQLKHNPDYTPLQGLSSLTRCIAFPMGIPSELLFKIKHDKPRPDLKQLNDYVFCDTPYNEDLENKLDSEFEKESIRWIEANGIEGDDDDEEYEYEYDYENF